MHQLLDRITELTGGIDAALAASPEEVLLKLVKDTGQSNDHKMLIEGSPLT